MNELSEFISNRELAIIIWGGIFLIWAYSKKSIRKSIIPFFKSLSQRTILLVIILMFVYVSLIVFSLYLFQLWEVTDLFDTVIWFLGGN